MCASVIIDIAFDSGCIQFKIVVVARASAVSPQCMSYMYLHGTVNKFYAQKNLKRLTACFQDAQGTHVDEWQALQEISTVHNDVHHKGHYNESTNSQCNGSIEASMLNLATKDNNAFQWGFCHALPNKHAETHGRHMEDT